MQTSLSSFDSAAALTLMVNSAPDVFGITTSEDASVVVFLNTCTFVFVSRTTTPDSPTKLAFRCFVTKTTAPKSSHASFSLPSRIDIPSTCSSIVVVFFAFFSFLLSSNSFAAYSLHNFLTLLKDSHVNAFVFSFPLPKRPSPPIFARTIFFHPLPEYSALSAFANRLRRSSFRCKSPSLSSLNLLLVLLLLLDSSINIFFSGSFVFIKTSVRPMSLSFRSNKSRIISKDSSILPLLFLLFFPSSSANGEDEYTHEVSSSFVSFDDVFAADFCAMFPRPCCSSSSSPSYSSSSRDSPFASLAKTPGRTPRTSPTRRSLDTE
mmetsp:Transcript_7421/g.24575  ORF Transcript_7421/g.24575 Transcript_7421/m.24575 type:complete len:321 (-) Transcript_7421:489-1451(-)